MPKQTLIFTKKKPIMTATPKKPVLRLIKKPVYQPKTRNFKNYA